MKQTKTYLDLPAPGDHSSRGRSTPYYDSKFNHAWQIEGWLIKKLMSLVGNPQIRVKLWDGQEHYRSPEGETGPVFTITNRTTFWRFFLNPNLHFGDSYCYGTITCAGSDLIELLEAFYRTRVLHSQPGPLQRFASQGLYRVRRNTQDR